MAAIPHGGPNVYHPSTSPGAYVPQTFHYSQSYGHCQPPLFKVVPDRGSGKWNFNHHAPGFHGQRSVLLSHKGEASRTLTVVDEEGAETGVRREVNAHKTVRPWVNQPFTTDHSARSSEVFRDEEVRERDQPFWRGKEGAQQENPGWLGVGKFQPQSRQGYIDTRQCSQKYVTSNQLYYHGTGTTGYHGPRPRDSIYTWVGRPYSAPQQSWYTTGNGSYAAPKK